MFKFSVSKIESRRTTVTGGLINGSPSGERYSSGKECERSDQTKREFHLNFELSVGLQKIVGDILSCVSEKLRMIWNWLLL